MGIQGDTIAAIGSLEGLEARRVLDATGMVVAPGFIDVHGHSDAVLLCDRAYDAKLRQGVTTEVIGCCGMSMAPCPEGTASLVASYTGAIAGGFQPDYSWRTFGGFLQVLRRTPLPVNVVPLVGHGTLRLAVLGYARRAAAPEELAAMGRLVEEAMDAGAFGMSSGLVYPPGVYAGTEELVSLCRVVARHGGVYSTHIRNESHRVREAVQEAIQIGARAGLPVIVSHFKVMGRRNWGRVNESLGVVEAARSGGLPVWLDLYPYTANSTLLTALLPPWAAEGGPEALSQRLRDPLERTRIREFIEQIDDGSWENFVADAGGWAGIMLSSLPASPELEGQSLVDVAARWGVHPADVLCEVLLRNGGTGTVVCFTMDEADLRTVLKYPATMIGSDGIPGTGKPHPRLYGTFPRVLARYWREGGLLGLEEAVRKMTGLPAQVLGLADRGSLRVGNKADLVVFDPGGILDTATYSEPRSYPRGIRWVVVNGRVAVEDGMVSDSRAGRLLRRGR